MSATNRGGIRLSLDRYYTPDLLAEVIVETLRGAQLLRKGDVVLEPHVGLGSFVRPLRSVGCRLIVNDINPDAPGLKLQGVKALSQDFLTLKLKKKVDWIIGNPPFTGFEDHVEHALECAVNVGFILRVGAFEAKKRQRFWRKHFPRAVWAISPRPSFTGKGNDSATYAFVVWSEGKSVLPSHFNILFWK